jgi:hypothetical protein
MANFLTKIRAQLRAINHVRKERRDYKRWLRKGRPNPPPHRVKQEIIQKFQRRSNYTTFVETGTFRGDMVEAQKRQFDTIYSIELSQYYYERAVERFKGIPHIHLLFGDSSVVLPSIIAKLDSPAIFWLDGHYSAGQTAKGDKECPILEEIDTIFSGKPLDHIILIDDARCFNGEGDYPTIESLTASIQEKDNRYHIAVENDVIRCIVVHL